MILVTGGAGFIGSNFVKYMNKIGEPCLVVDKLTYAGNESNLDGLDCIFVQEDICNTKAMLNLLLHYDPRGIINFAAESHVDNSIKDSLPFIQTNIVGTYSLLEAVRKYRPVRTERMHGRFRFHQISTDEVYGHLGDFDPPFTEKTKYDPRSPYSASKASADHLVASYGNTYGIPYTITNCSNNYGPNQHKEKLIPTIIRNALQDKPVPMYGQGYNVRDWIHVDDHCQAIWKVFLDSRDNNVYNVGGGCQMSNLRLIKLVLELMNKPEHLITSVDDRPGHDFRYAIDNTKIETELGWYPNVFFRHGLEKTIEWYINEYKKDLGNYSSSR
jgi:dTDP-glucose 4,6-dehydratase